ncbi:uncharacterized protein LOC129350745 [Amphiprion ocellaris]|uniref:uncharacterized protein LOC129348482 n=1 Tax=Amphiprion ocellaris TaxID=80972 RepID=UPI000C304C29|nr:uncharacterized protein LOC129348482 [Amphiprion ocellaris]XP_054874200.1 uncharacterized protein LOC129350745 [Amphiprion ocellaris]
MDFRLVDIEGPVGAAPEVHRDAAGFVDYVVERPANGLPELIWIIDDDDRVVVFNDSDESSEEEDSEDDWSTSEDSGYGSLDEDEEDPEDGEEEDIRPRSPLVQRLPPPAGAPVIAAPAAPPQEDLALHIISFPKRPWEESDVEAQVGTKRQRTSEEDNQQPGPSTSGATNHSASGPSTSGLSSSVTSGNWFRPFWSPDDSDSD